MSLRHCARRSPHVYRFSVPVLWDKKHGTIVNNESSEIVRMFNTAFNDQLPADKAALDLYPERLRKDIDDVNEWMYDTVNSTSQSVLLCIEIDTMSRKMACIAQDPQRHRKPMKML